MKCVALLVFHLYSYGNSVNQEVAKCLKQQLTVKLGETYSAKEVNRTCPVTQLLDWGKKWTTICVAMHIFSVIIYCNSE